MRLEIEWAPQARKDYFEILDYLIEEFGLASAQKFDSHLEEVLQLLSHFPRMCPESEAKKGLFRCVLNKHTTLYYQLSGQKINLLAFWNNRRNPQP